MSPPRRATEMKCTMQNASVFRGGGASIPAAAEELVRYEGMGGWASQRG